jgi:hypothetical protein
VINLEDIDSGMPRMVEFPGISISHTCAYWRTVSLSCQEMWLTTAASR